MNFPPHLPNPSVSVDLHRRVGYFKLFLALTVVALVAGLSGAAMLLGWVWPYVGVGNFNAPNLRVAVSHSRLDETMRHDLDNTVLNVYNGVTSAGGVETLSSENLIGSAVVVGSDGWLALYHSGAVVSVKNWRAISLSGARWRVTSAIPDARSGLLYLKVEREGVRALPLRPVVFARWRDSADETFFWDGGVWHSAFIEGQRAHALTRPHLDSAPATEYILSVGVPPGAVVVNQSGALVGLGKGGLSMLPAEYVNRVWVSVREAGKAVYPTLGLEGWFTDEAPVFVNSQAVPGFFITHVFSSTTTLQRGDIITLLNGEAVSAADWWDALATPAVRVTVRRASSTLELTAPVVRLP